MSSALYSGQCFKSASLECAASRVTRGHVFRVMNSTASTMTQSVRILGSGLSYSGTLPEPCAQCLTWHVPKWSQSLGTVVVLEDAFAFRKIAIANCTSS